MNKDIRFYDTCSLLIAGESVFEQNDTFLVSSITFNELEKIKSASNKSPEVKYTARLLLRLFDQYPQKYMVIVHTTAVEEVITEKRLVLNDDTRILSDAIWYDTAVRPDEVIFVTNDIALRCMANLFFGADMIESVTEENDDYTGYTEIHVYEDDDENLIKLYQDPTQNIYSLLIGEYLIIRNSEKEIVDIRCWNGKEYRHLNYNSFNSTWFGKVKPYNNDIYQKLLFDSLSNNKITMVKGPAGSGKTITSLAFLMSKLEHGELDKLVIFCNTVATANSAKLGYLPGDRDSKLLDSQIGNLLISKFGGRDAVEQLIHDERLILLPLSDIRGYDTSGMRAGVYISEAQNLDRPLMKLALQRIGEDCICIIDGDYNQQVDMAAYAGSNNGMRRASKIFRGTEIYGEVELKNIYRSRISQIAEAI